MDFIIPARGGSKGIKNKNIRLFNGHPLIAWSIDAAHGSFLGDVYVSSDSKKILSVAKNYDAIPVKRPKNISDGKSKSEHALLDVIKKHDLSDTICFLQCTSPWITNKDIAEAYKQYKKHAPTPLFFMKKAHTYPYLTKDDKAMSIFAGREMRQDMNEVVEVGAYIFDKKKFLIYKDRYCGKAEINHYVIDRELPNEIDSELDWLVNESYFYYWNGSEKFSLDCSPTKK
jgi:CMP-N,N'-diacetyllegionaminic acid synthase